MSRPRKSYRSSQQSIPQLKLLLIFRQIPLTTLWLSEWKLVVLTKGELQLTQLRRISRLCPYPLLKRLKISPYRTLSPLFMLVSQSSKVSLGLQPMVALKQHRKTRLTSKKLPKHSKPTRIVLLKRKLIWNASQPSKKKTNV